MTDTLVGTAETLVSDSSQYFVGPGGSRPVMSILIHGEPGTGKSTIAGTAVGPILVGDAEGGVNFVRSYGRRRYWNPLTEEPPVNDGTWDSCVVKILDWATLEAIYLWLVKLGPNAPFRSIVLDSLTEMQKRLMDSIAGTSQPSLQQWGDMGRRLQDMVRKIRDLVLITTPIQQIVVICLSHLRDEQVRPMIQGQTELALPGYFDIVGYCLTQTNDTTGKLDHFVLVEKQGKIIAKDRTGTLKEANGGSPFILDANLSTWLGHVVEFF